MTPKTLILCCTAAALLALVGYTTLPSLAGCATPHAKIATADQQTLDVVAPIGDGVAATSADIKTTAAHGATAARTAATGADGARGDVRAALATPNLPPSAVPPLKAAATKLDTTTKQILVAEADFQAITAKATELDVVKPKLDDLQGKLTAIAQGKADAEADAAKWHQKYDDWENGALANAEWWGLAIMALGIGLLFTPLGKFALAWAVPAVGACVFAAAWFLHAYGQIILEIMAWTSIAAGCWLVYEVIKRHGAFTDLYAFGEKVKTDCPSQWASTWKAWCLKSHGWATKALVEEQDLAAKLPGFWSRLWGALTGQHHADATAAAATAQAVALPSQPAPAPA